MATNSSKKIQGVFVNQRTGLEKMSSGQSSPVLLESSKEGQTTRKRNKLRKWWRTSKWTAGLRRFLGIVWVFEVSSLILAWFTFGMIILTLALHQDQAQPHWKYRISVNSLVSILSTITQAALVMPISEGIGQLKWRWFRQKKRALVDFERIDAATRGPWGSFMVLARFFKSFLICLGAIITIVALAIGPFTQQVLQFYPCRQPTSLVATLPATVNYERVSNSSDGYLDRQMSRAIYNGLIDPMPNASANIPFNCPTGNCTFPASRGATHMSMAMCTRCTDLSDTISAVYSTTGTLTNIKHILPVGSDPDSYTKGEISILTNSTLEAHGVTIDWIQIPMALRLYAPNDTRSYISAFDLLMYTDCNCTYVADYTTHSCQCRPFAANCALYPCVKEFHGEVNNFILNETEISSTPMQNASDGSYQWDAEEVIRNGQWHQCTADNNTGCHWSMTWNSAASIRDYFARWIWINSLGLSDLSVPSSATGSPWIQTLYNDGFMNMANLTIYMNGLANSMTAVIREYGVEPDNTVVKGLADSLQTCVGVRWPWLSLPGALLIFATIFLIATIVTTRTKPNMIWKSSALAVLFHSLDTEIAPENQTLIHSDEMTEKAKSVEVKLQQKDTAWALVAT